MKVSQAINDVNSGRIKPQKAVDEFIPCLPNMKKPLPET